MAFITVCFGFIWHAFKHLNRLFVHFSNLLKDTHRQKAPSNKTPALKKSKNMGVWAVGTLNQLFIRGFLTETKLSKK